MNAAQRLWWRQVRSDYAVYVRLRDAGEEECHLLHYLQMVTEKLSKAYLWRSGEAPSRTHARFAKFLKSLLDRPRGERERVAESLGFDRWPDFQRWITQVQPLAHALEKMAPAEAGDGPNPEYPWPHEAPTECPVGHAFALWDRLAKTGHGRKLLNVIDRAVEHFDIYA